MLMKKIMPWFLFLLLLTAGCEKEIEPNLSVADGKEITLEEKANSETTVSFTSAREWEVTANRDWLNVSPASGGAGTWNITLTTTSENKTGTTRTATVHLTSLSLTYELTVRQPSSFFVELEQDTYQVPADGDILYIRFTTNVGEDELSVYGTADWLVQNTGSRSTTPYALTLKALPNTDGSSRTARILFYKGTGDDEILLNTVTISQEGASAGSSSDYSADRTVRILQKSTLGKGLPVVLMGDGFIDTEIADGTYDRVMDKAWENLFTEEPFKSLRDYFDVYAVTAVSPNNNFGSGYRTAFGCELEGGTSTGISGDDDVVMEYVESIDGIDLEETLAVVILNSSAYAGTTYFGYSSGSETVEFAVAYCPVINNMESESFRQVLVHEAVGHGFAKLEDEYSYKENGSIPDSEIRLVQRLQSLGWAQNVDFTDDESEVLWAGFINDERYASEEIGIYEGACTYISGAYRPTYESMMNSNTSGFNAPSRKAIYDMVMKRAIQQEPTFEEFVAFDLDTGSNSNAVQVRAISASPMRPFARPRFSGKALTEGKR